MTAPVLGFLSGLGFLIRLGFEITLIVVALTSVRKERPDAAYLLVGAGGVQVLNSLASYGLSIAMPFLVASMGSEYRLGIAVQQGVTMMISSVAYVLLIMGVVRLAKPAQTGAVDPGRYV